MLSEASEHEIDHEYAHHLSQSEVTTDLHDWNAMTVPIYPVIGNQQVAARPHS